jgi:hypothetical protein
MATRLKQRNGLRRVGAHVPHWEARGCGKVAFPSKRAAEGRAKSIGKGLMGYKCPVCRRWHIGHPSKERERI